MDIRLSDTHRHAMDSRRRDTLRLWIIRLGATHIDSMDS